MNEERESEKRDGTVGSLATKSEGLTDFMHSSRFSGFDYPDTIDAQYKTKEFFAD